MGLRQEADVVNEKASRALLVFSSRPIDRIRRDLKYLAPSTPALLIIYSTTVHFLGIRTQGCRCPVRLAVCLYIRHMDNIYVLSGQPQEQDSCFF